MRRNNSDRGNDFESNRDSRISGAAPRGRAEYGYDRPNLGSARSDYGDRAYGGRLNREGDESGRGMMDRAADEVLSWFGDEDAARRRNYDTGETGRYEDRDRYQGTSGNRGSYYESRRMGGYRNESGSARRARAADVMTSDVATVRPEDPVTHAARLMVEENVGAIPVVDRNGRARGMITDRDITCRIVAEGDDIRRARVGDAMTDEIFTCHASDPLGELMRTMRDHMVRRVPIVDDNDRIIGIVSQADIARVADRELASRNRFADTVSEISEPTERPYRD